MIISGGITSGGILSGGIWGGGVSARTGGARGFGAYLNFLTSVFRTTVPQASSRTFLETHVYTGSPKLTLQSTGFTGWNAHNLIPNSGDMSTSSWASNLMSATVTNTGILSVTGDTFFSCVATAGAGNHFRSNANVAPNAIASTQYIIRVRIRAGNVQWTQIGDSNDAVWHAVNVDTTNKTISNQNGATGTVTDLGNGELLVEITYTRTNASAITVFIAPAITSSQSTPSFTAAGTETCVGTSFQVLRGNTVDKTYLKTAFTVPRLDAPYYYNTSGTRQGILVEPAATNNSLYSQDGAQWNASANIALTANAATAPDGTATATKLAATSASGYHHSFRALTGTNTSTVSGCYSCFVESDGVAQYAYLMLGSNGVGITNAAYAIFNIPRDGSGSSSPTGSGVLGLGTFTSGKSTYIGNGRYRIEIIGINGTVADTTLPYVGLTNSPTSPTTATFAGTEFIYAWGRQYEYQGTIATSYIPTTTAAVARSIDTMYRVLGPEKITPAASPGTLVVKALASKLSGTQQVVDIDVNNSTERIELSYNGTTLRGDIAGLTANATLGTPSVGVFDTWGIAFANNDVAACGNGGTVQTDASAPLTQQYLIMRFGKATYGGEDFTGAIARVRLWGSRISNADLQSATLGNNPSTPQLDFDYANATYTITPVNAGITTTYTAATLLSSGKMTQTGPTTVYLRGSTGLLEAKTVATDLLIEYAADGSVLGFIGDEPARTNSMLQTNDLAASAWTANRSTRSVGSQAGPINGVNLTRWTETTANGAHGCYSTAGVVTTAAPWTLSMFVRKGTKKYVTILMNNVGNNAWSVFDLDNGTITQSGTAAVEGGVWSAPTAKIETFSPGLYRISLTATLTVITTVVGYYASDLSTIPSLAGWAGYVGNVNDYIDVGCIQFEAGSYASSYIPTVGSTVNRAAIVSTLNLGSEFDNSRSIVASKAYAGRANMTDGSVTPAVWSLNIATAASTNYEVIYLTSTNQINYLDRVSSTDGAAGVATSLSYPATIKTAFGYSPSNVFLSLNGATQAVTGTPSAIQASYTNMQLGRSERTNVTQGSVYIQNLTIAATVPTQDNVNTAASAV